MNDSEFTAEELALLNAAKDESDGQGTDLPADDKTVDTPQADQQAATQASEQAAVVEAPVVTTETQEPAKPAQEERPTGDVRAALRASRRAEDRTRRENERLRQENEDLKAGKVAPPPGGVDPELLQDIEADFPQVAGAFKALTKQVEELSKAQAKPAPHVDPEFIPPALPAELQAVVDEIPDLLDWQLNPDQTNFELAKQADGMLERSPKWMNATKAARFAEVVRLVKEQTEPAATSIKQTPAKPATAAEAAAVIAAAANTTPVGIGDLRGSATPTKTEPDFTRMTDDQIMAALPR